MKPAVIVLCVSVFLFVLIFAIAGPEHAGLPDREVSVSLDCYCGESELDTLQAYESIKRKDLHAIVGLIERKKIKALATGDRARVIYSSDALSWIRVTSGMQIGEKCWIPTGLLR